jgi:hypothetical protein
MSTAVAVIDGLGGDVLSPAELTARMSMIQHAMTANMQKGIDYGKIPGTPKPTLFKPGAEKLCAMFKIAPDYISEDLSTHDSVRIRVKCIGKLQGTDAVLGAGVGECSTEETKYKWRKPVCVQEFDETAEDRRRSKWMIGKNGKPYKATQVRTEPADLANTVLKMAAKRAHIAMVLNLTGATAIFTQDVEDLPQEIRPANVDEDGVIHEEPTTRKPPQARANATGVINEQQLRMLQRKMDDAGMTAEQVCTRFNIDALIGLQFSDLNTALAYVADPQMQEARQ